MKINQTQSSVQNSSFRGKLILNGNATKYIRDAFMNSKTLQKLAEGEYDIVGTVYSREASRYEIYNRGRDDTLYKLILAAKKQTKGGWDKIMSLFNFKPAINLSRNYHSEETTAKIIDNHIKLDVLKKKLKI